MSSQANVVKVIHRQTGEELFRCPVEDRERAFQFAEQMEALEIEVDLEGPNAIESLGNCLGLNARQAEKLKESLQEEIKEH